MPIGLTMIFEAMLFNSATLIMGTFGTASVAAHQIAMNVPSITFMVPLGIGMAATVRVGLAPAHAIRRPCAAVRLCGDGHRRGLHGGDGIFLWIFPIEVASIWFANPSANMDVIVLAAAFLHIAAAFQVFDGLQVVGCTESARLEGRAYADVDRGGQLLARGLSSLPLAAPSACT